MKRIGFGVVEPNHLSAQKTGQIYAQLPAEKNIEILENGQFAKYDYAKGEVNFTATDNEWLLVFNEIKLYEGVRENLKDFALEKKHYTDGVMTPRLLKTNIGDIFTTNCLSAGATSKHEEVAMPDYTVGDIVAPNAKGYLAKDGDVAAMQFKVVKIYTMPDGQPGVKLQRVA